MLGDFNYFNPLAVYACQLGLSQQKRFALADMILSDTEAQEGDDKFSSAIADVENSWTGDVNGHSNLHTREDFAEVFDLIRIGVFEYINGLGVDGSKLDVYFTRSWAVKQEGKQVVSLHDHSQSHISVCYYPKVSPNAGAFVVSPEELPNEFLPNLFSDDHHRNTGLIDPANKHTKKEFYLKPIDDLLLIFPSKMFHKVLPNSKNCPYPRYSISADLVCTVKEEDSHEHCLPPLSMWKKIEETKHD